MYQFKGKWGYVGALAIIAVAISLLMVYCGSNSQLEAYQGEETITTEPAVTEKKIPLTTYSVDNLGLSYGIPEDWTHVIKDGFDTYIHAPSTSSIQIQISDYVPTVNLLTEQSLNIALTQSGYTLLQFQWLTNASYYLLYTNDTTVYIELTNFDKTTMVCMKCSYLKEHQDRILDTVTAVIDSLQWNKANPYPDNVVICYSEHGSFEFAMPNGWQSGVVNNAYVAQEPTSGTVMSVTASASETTYDTLTQLGYVNWASSGRTSFSLQSYQATSSSVYATSTYTANGINMVLVQYLVATGKFEYAVSFEIPYDHYSEVMDTASMLISLFKIYNN